jgi:hypothetical protein
MWGLMWGYLGDARETNALPDRAMKGWCIWQGSVEACAGTALRAYIKLSSVARLTAARRLLTLSLL